jgi:putative addiction module antidote
MHTLKVIAIGNACGVILPKETTARLRVTTGDTLWLTLTPHGIALTPHNPEVVEQLEAGQKLMSDYCDTFKALAK